MTRPTAAPARFPYSEHRTCEEVARDQTSAAHEAGRLQVQAHVSHAQEMLARRNLIARLAEEKRALPAGHWFA